MGILYTFISSRWSRRKALVCSLAILLAKECFDILAVQTVDRIGPPDMNDLLDILSGLLGIAFGEGLLRLFRRREKRKGGVE
jgi:glycopeptide antibiotics resistance protein